MNTKKNSPIPTLNSPKHPYYAKQTRLSETITMKDKTLPLPDFQFNWAFPDEQGLTTDPDGNFVKVPDRQAEFCSLYDPTLRC